MRTYGTSETFNVTPSRIVNIIMLNMLVGMKDSNVKYVINDLAASQDKKIFLVRYHLHSLKEKLRRDRSK